MSESEEHSSSPIPLTSDKTVGIFYGWWIVAGSMVTLVFSCGIGFYSHGAILDPLRIHYGWSKGVISTALTLYFATSAVLGMAVGRSVDRFGSKPLLILGSVITGIGFFLLSRITHLWQLFAVYLILACGTSCASTITITTLIANWFVFKRGLALGVTMSGLSLGGMIMVPFTVYLIAHWGLRTALPILGGIFCLAVIPIALFLIKQHPADVGQFPDGLQEAPLSFDPSNRSISFASQMRVWTRAEAMQTTTFWAIVIGFLLAMTGQLAFLVHQVSFLSRTLGVVGAAKAVSVTTGASVISRLFLGSVADRFDKRYVAIFCFLVQGIAVLFMARFHQVVVLYLGTFAFGLTMGGIVMMQSLLIGDCFGMVSFGTIIGFSGLFTQLGASFGPTIAGLIFDATRDYRIAFTIFGMASLSAIGAIFFAKPPKPLPQASAAARIRGPY
jgi:MFS family permease